MSFITRAGSSCEDLILRQLRCQLSIAFVVKVQVGDNPDLAFRLEHVWSILVMMSNIPHTFVEARGRMRSFSSRHLWSAWAQSSQLVWFCVVLQAGSHFRYGSRLGGEPFGASILGWQSNKPQGHLNVLSISTGRQAPRVLVEPQHSGCQMPRFCPRSICNNKSPT